MRRSDMKKISYVMIVFSVMISMLLSGCTWKALDVYEEPVLLYNNVEFGEGDGNGRDLSAYWDVSESEKRILRKVYYGEKKKIKKLLTIQHTAS